MNEQEMDITIADHCWTLNDGVHPAYSNDLNEMHKAELVLSERQTFDYECHLREAVSGKWGFWYTPHSGEIFQVSHATARQRAEAFLRTIGKWVD